MSVQTKDRVITKATKAANAQDWSKGDDVIKTLTVVVFNKGAYTANGYNAGDVVASFSGSVTQNADGIASLSGEGLLSGDVEMLLIANLESEVVGTISGYVTQNKGTGHYNKSDVLALTTDLKNEVNVQSSTDKGLTMSKLIAVTLQPGDNYVGWNSNKQVVVQATDTDLTGIELVRTVAYVELKQITLQLPEEYGTARLFVDSVFIANAKGGSYIDENDNGYCEASGASYYIGSEGWKDATGTYKTAAATNLPRLGTVIRSEKQPPLLEVSETAKENTITDMFACGGTPFYVYENWKTSENNTLLIVEGDFYYSNQEGASAVAKDKAATEASELWIKVPKRYFTVIVNDADFRGANDNNPGYEHVKRNTKYIVSLTIAGTGSPDPFTPAAFAHVAAQVEVAAWNVINIEQPVD